MVQYSAVCVFNEEMDQVVLVHKLRPSWQLNKANFPGGKVESCDGNGFDKFVNCASRELCEETGLKIDPCMLNLFCVLHFAGGICYFFVTVTRINSAKTQELEKIFIGNVDEILTKSTTGYDLTLLNTMPNLPSLISIAKKVILSNDKSIYEIHERNLTFYL